MKFISALLVALLVFCGGVDARSIHGTAPAPPVTGIGGELVINGDLVSEQVLLNQFKTSNGWEFANNTGRIPPDQITASGYPIAGKAWDTSATGAKTLLTTLNSYVVPGNRVLDGTGKANLIVTFGSTGTLANVSCTGVTAAFGGGFSCDNTGCSAFIGSVSVKTLRVTTAPTGTGCTLGPGVPISITSGSTLTDKFGTKTYITTTGSSCFTTDTCYTLNQAPGTFSAGTSFVVGYHAEMSITAPYIGAGFDLFVVQTFLFTTGTINNLDNMAFFYKSDEAATWAASTPCGLGQACIVGTLFKERFGPHGANFSRFRDLDLTYSNVSLCSTWATRRTLNYVTYVAGEARNASSGPGQYVNAAGTGATGGTVSYNAGTDVYSITLGSGGPVDKQSIIMMAPATGTGSSKISLNGTTAVPIANPWGAAPSFVTLDPTTNHFGLLVYDKDLNLWLWNGNSNGFECAVPPEVFIELVAEMSPSTSDVRVPWHVLPYMAMDAMTDWVTQYSTYVKTNFPQTKLLIEVSNEPFNCATWAPSYLTVKSNVWKALDPTAWADGTHFCGPAILGGNNMAEIGKMSSTVGQDYLAVYGAGNYDLALPTQVVANGFNDSSNDAFSAVAYTTQNFAAQSGYIKAPAWNYVTRVSINDYWSTGYNTKSQEVKLGWCYFAYSISTGCQAVYASQAAVMTEYMNSSSLATCGTLSCSLFNLFYTNTYYAGWNTFAATCGQVTRPAGCVLNPTAPIVMYEGGYNQAALVIDYIGGLGTGTAASSAVFIMPNSGCQSGQSVTLDGGTGGWTSAPGTYTVQATGTDATHCAVNLNSTGFAAMFSSTLTAGYNTNNQTIAVAACPPSITGTYFSVYNQTTGVYAGPGASCSGGVITMALFNSPIGTAFGNAFVLNGSGNIGDTIVFAPTIKFNGSQNYVNYFQSISYTAPELKPLTTAMISNVFANGGSAPSQFHAGNSIGYINNGQFFPWFIWGGDVAGFFAVAQCSSCNIVNTTMTLGGTIQGKFDVGQVLFGGQITGIGTGAGSNTSIVSCTKVGTGPCGSNVNDQLTLSQGAITLTGVTIVGTIPPATNFNATGVTSPVKAWGAFCILGGTSNYCDGP